MTVGGRARIVYIWLPERRVIASLRLFRICPQDATIDDAIERLGFLAKIDAGLAELDGGKVISHEEVKKRLRV